MTPERAKEILKKMEKQSAKSRRGRGYFQLLRNRDQVTEALEATIDKTGSRNLFENHEVTRKEGGTWVWRNTKKARKPAPCQKTWIE